MHAFGVPTSTHLQYYFGSPVEKQTQSRGHIRPMKASLMHMLKTTHTPNEKSSICRKWPPPAGWNIRGFALMVMDGVLIETVWVQSSEPEKSVQTLQGRALWNMVSVRKYCIRYSKAFSSADPSFSHIILLSGRDQMGCNGSHLTSCFTSSVNHNSHVNTLYIHVLFGTSWDSFFMT